MRILVVDAFTDRPFAGNPAGVCLLTGPADPGWMQRLATELGYSETAYLRPLTGDGADFELRWFTPANEVALCGHATLAGAHALYETGAFPAGRPVRFQSLHSGVLTVAGGDGGLEMDFPARPAAAVEPSEGLAEDLAEGLGVPIAWTGRNAESDLLVEIADEASVRGLAPDHDALGRVGCRAAIVTAAAGPGRPYDFVSRVFASSQGVPEDPVTGSAHCALGPYWAERLGRTELVGYQASARGGTVGVSVRGDRVVLTGRAVTVLDGDLKV